MGVMMVIKKSVNMCWLCCCSFCFSFLCVVLILFRMDVWFGFCGIGWGVIEGVVVLVVVLIGMMVGVLVVVIFVCFLVFVVVVCVCVEIGVVIGVCCLGVKVCVIFLLVWWFRCCFVVFNVLLMVVCIWIWVGFNIDLVRVKRLLLKMLLVFGVLVLVFLF